MFVRFGMKSPSGEISALELNLNLIIFLIEFPRGMSRINDSRFLNIHSNFNFQPEMKFVALFNKNIYHEYILKSRKFSSQDKWLENSNIQSNL